MPASTVYAYASTACSSPRAVSLGDGPEHRGTGRAAGQRLGDPSDAGRLAWEGRRPGGAQQAAAHDERGCALDARRPSRELQLGYPTQPLGVLPGGRLPSPPGQHCIPPRQREPAMCREQRLELDSSAHEPVYGKRLDPVRVREGARRERRVGELEQREEPAAGGYVPRRTGLRG